MRINWSDAENEVFFDTISKYAHQDESTVLRQIVASLSGSRNWVQCKGHFRNLQVVGRIVHTDTEPKMWKVITDVGGQKRVNAVKSPSNIKHSSTSDGSKKDGSNQCRENDVQMDSHPPHSMHTTKSDRDVGEEEEEEEDVDEEDEEDRDPHLMRQGRIESDHEYAANGGDSNVREDEDLDEEDEDGEDGNTGMSEQRKVRGLTNRRSIDQMSSGERSAEDRSMEHSRSSYDGGKATMMGYKKQTSSVRTDSQTNLPQLRMRDAKTNRRYGDYRSATTADINRFSMRK